ncbi:MAG: glycosyltransferase [Anaerolineales bacterium]|nr:glycosyltransferase [Anaerolineales bacterium]
MTRIVIYSADPWDSAISYLRVREPAHYLGWELVPAKTDTEIDINSIENADYVIIQRDFPRFPQCETITQTARQNNIPVIYEIDDCIFNTPVHNKQFEAYRYYFNGILNTITGADRVIVSSNYLYKQLAPFNQYIYLFPNYLPDRIWTFRQPEIGNSSIITIGYMGSNTHTQDLEWLAPVLVQILEQNKNVQLKIWGCLPPDSLIQRPEVHYQDIDIQDYTRFADYFQTQTCDLFIAPLPDSPFNQGKSGIKFLEYSAGGIPGVYMKTAPYLEYIVDGENGFLASNAQEWQDKLMRLISEADMRYRMGQNAQKMALQHRLSDHFHEWEDAILGNPAPPKEKTLSDSFHDPMILIRNVNTNTQKAIWDIQRELSQARRDIAALKQKVTDLENEKSGLNEHLQNILNSRTWKIAKFIQSIAGVFKSKKGSTDQ